MSVFAIYNFSNVLFLLDSFVRQSFYVLVLTLIVVTMYHFVNYKQKRRSLEKIVSMYDGPPMLPLVGNGLDFVGSSSKDFLPKVFDLARTYKSNFRIWIAHKPYIVIVNPQDYETIGKKVLCKDDSYKFMANMFGDGLITSNGKKWRKNQRIINPTLNIKVLNDYFLKIFNKQSDKLINKLANEVDTGRQFDAWAPVIETAICTIAETALGIDDIEEESAALEFGQAIIKCAELVSQRFYKPWLMIPVVFHIYKYIFGYSHSFNTIHDFPKKLLKIKKRKLEILRKNKDPDQENTKRNFINTLISFHETSADFTEQHLLDEVKTIMFAGSGTFAITVCFTLEMLAIHQKIQEKVYEELLAIFEDSNRQPTVEDLNKMTLLDKCIKETMRLYPPVPLVIRYTDTDVILENGSVIPAGANIVLGIMGIHRNPDIYAEPETWNPNNFDPERVANRHKCTFLPFSMGPRKCIGNDYAMLGLKAQLSTILRNYKISTDVKMEDIELDMDLVIRNANGHQIKLNYRHGKSIS